MHSGLGNGLTNMTIERVGAVRRPALAEYLTPTTGIE